MGRNFDRSIAPSAINIDPAICNGHLSYPWGRRWGEGRVGIWPQGVGLRGSVEQNFQEREKFEGVRNLIFRAFCIHELAHKSL